MGCDRYIIDGIEVCFGGDYENGCICTFPGNREGKIDANDLESFAYLGLAVKLIHENIIKADKYGFVSIPSDIPEQYRQEIKKHFIHERKEGL